jgi:hypothetical protein
MESDPGGTMRKQGLIVLTAIAAVSAIALNTGPAAARQGADDPVGHVRHGRGADDPVRHVRHHERHHVRHHERHHVRHRHAADDKRAHTARHGRGADDAAGDDRRGRGRGSDD